MMRNVLRGAGLAVAVVAVSVSVSAGSGHAGGLPCSVDETIMGVTEVLWYEDGTVMETDEGNLVCHNGYWEGPNVDSPLPGGGGGTILA